MQQSNHQVTMKGNPMPLSGTQIHVGDTAPDFVVLDGASSPVKLSDFKGKVKIINAVPSVDTSVCDAQVHRFNSEAAKLGNTVIFSVSVDLPFALRRYCAAEGIDAVKVTSDHINLDFGKKYGVVIEPLRILARAVFVVDQNDKVIHVEYVSEVGNEPDYDKALSVAKSVA